MNKFLYASGAWWNVAHLKKVKRTYKSQATPQYSQREALFALVEPNAPLCRVDFKVLKGEYFVPSTNRHLRENDSALK